MDEHILPGGMPHGAANSPEALLIGGAVYEKKEEAAKANPINYVSSDDVPFLIVHGDADPIVPYHQSVILESALKKAGVPVTFYGVIGGGHGGFDDPKVPEITKKFLSQHLK
jgi:dipeptidyl aminopeptidase/acylaminoacyl peptidase